MKQLDVPFIENPNDRCAVVCLGMVLKYFEPERQYSMSELEELAGYQKDLGTWPTEHMLQLADRGYALEWIEDFNMASFVDNPIGYLKKILKNPEVLEWQLAHSGNIAREASRAKTYLDRGLPFEHRQATKADITRLLDKSWLVGLQVNASTLNESKDYDGHSILVVGYDEKNVIIHNPDGKGGNKPNQVVSWELLQKAWEEFGGSFTLFGYFKGKV